MKLSDVSPNIIYKNTMTGISIEWENEIEVDKFFNYVLVRNQLRSPRSHFDGVEVYRGKETHFLDTDVKNGENYYYVLYFTVGYAQKSKEADYYLINDDCRFNITALLECNSAKLIYNHLPGLYRAYDAQIDENEEFNFPLYRMCRVFGYEFDKLYTFTDKIYDVIDIDNCPIVMLPSLMKFLGVDYDWNLSSKENRILTKIKISAYSKRGTTTGLRLILMNLLKSKIEIIIPKDKVKRTASKSEIQAKRTITIRAYNFQSDFIWVEENYKKFLEVVDEFVPRKLNVKLVLINNFLDDYARKRLSDTYMLYDSNDISMFKEVSRKTIDDNFIKSSVVSDYIDSSYPKDFGERIAYRLIEGRRRVDIYTSSGVDEVGNWSLSSKDIYNKSNIDTSTSHTQTKSDDIIDIDIADTSASGFVDEEHLDSTDINISEEFIDTTDTSNGEIYVLDAIDEFEDVVTPVEQQINEESE